jgi:hypothetical protein
MNKDEETKRQALEVCEMVLGLIRMLVEEVNYVRDFLESNVIEVLTAINDISPQVQPLLEMFLKIQQEIEEKQTNKQIDSNATESSPSNQLQSNRSNQSTQIANTTKGFWSFRWLPLRRCELL